MMAASSRATVTGASAAALALATWAGTAPAAAILALLGIAFGLGWAQLVDVPATRGSGIVIALAALAAIGAAWATEAGLALVIAGGVIASFVHQMLRKDGRPRLVETLSATVMGVLVVTAGMGWFVLALAGALPVVLLGSAALLVASAASVLPARTWVILTAASVGAGGVGAAVGLTFAQLGPLPGALLGGVVGIVTALTQLLFSQFPTADHARAGLAAALMPLLTLGAPLLVLSSFVG